MKNSDILVVGSGPVGMAVARRLAECDLQVTVMEAGSAITDPPGSHFRNRYDVRQDPDGYFAAIDPYLHPVAGPGEETDLPGAADSSLFGGQGILWTNNCPRATEFERWEALTPSEWELKYAEAEEILQVVPALTADSRTGHKIRERLRDVLSDDARTVCELPFAGRILPAGEFYYNGPWDILAAAAPEVRNRIAIHSGAFVKRLRLQGRRVTGVETESTDKDVVLPADATVILAGGALAIPRLLYRSGIRPQALGRGFSFHALLFGQLVLKADLCPPEGESDIAPRLWIPPMPDSPWHIMVLRDTCPLRSAEEVKNSHRLLEFQAFLPVEFREENAFVIEDEEKAAFRFAFSQVDRERMQDMEADVRRLAAQLGQWRGGCECTWLPHGCAHLMGTCRMDRPGWEGVTNQAGRVHGFDNLYLASVGLFPAPVAENPTLTAVALALNSCEQILNG
jgi:choline dehydrogenase-like flavoprotein